MAKLSTYEKDNSISGEDLLVGSNYIGVDNYATNNFKIKDLSDYLSGQISIDPGNLPLKTNGGIVYETINSTDELAINLSHTNITGQLANSDLVNSYITINGTNVQLGGSVNIPVGDITAVTAGTYLNGGGATGDVTLNHDNTSRSDTTSTPSQLAYGGTFTAITSTTSNATGHLTAINTATYTLPASDNTDNYVDSIAVTGTTTKTITLGRTGALSDLAANFTDNDTIPNDATITLSAGTYISGGGDFTTDQSSAETITFNHDTTTRTDTTSSAGPNHGANFTVIDTLTSNATGHITAANVKTVTLPNGANDNTITLSAGTYLTGGGDFTVDQSFNETLTINHDATSRSDTTSSDSNNAPSDTFTAVDSVSTNATGHVTAVNLKTIEFPSDANTDVDVNVSNLQTRLGQIGNTTIGSSGSTITIPNLTVTGDQIINNVEVVSTSSGIIFEGTSNDANETTLNVINPTADRAINLPNNSGTVALLTDIPTVNDGTLTVQGSSGLTGSGTFTANDADSPTITISHADTSSQASVNNSGNAFIQDITVDTYGHITGLVSGTATNTITEIREDTGSYRTGSITLQSGTNVSITEPSTGVFNFEATNTVPNNGTLTVQGTGALGGSGTFTADQASNTTISISHDDTSSQASVDNSGNTFIQDITLDDYGHVTALGSATVSIGNGTLTVEGTGALGGSGTFTANQSGNTTISISHDDTSSQSSVNNSGRTYIQDITLDTYGHVTGLTSATETVTNTTYDLSVPASTTNIRLAGSDGTNDAVTITGGTNVTVTRNNASQLTISSTDTNTIPNNGILTINTAGIASGSGTFSADQAGDTTITITATEADTLATVTGRGASTSTNLTFNGTLTMGTSGTQYIRMGRFPNSTSNSGEAWIGRAADRSTGTMTVQLGNNTARTFEVVDNAWTTVIFSAGMNSFTYKGNTIWHAGNDGAGTGLDADLLDGQHASAFLTSESDTLATVTGRGNTTSTTVDLRNATPLIFTSNGNTDTYTQTAIYANQNNTSNSYANGIFIERGKLSNSNSAEIRHLVIGSRGGQRQFVFTEDKLGIGVDAPDYILHTLGSGNERVKIESTGNSTAGVYMQVKSSGSQVGTGTVRVDNSGNMNFFVGGSSEAERLRIYGPTGQVSVGTSTVPSNIKFQTDGDIRINSTSGSLWIGGYNDSQAGRVRLHSSNGAGYLDWEASSGTSNFIFRYDTNNRFEMSSGGTFTASADIVAYGSPSDITLKENIKPIENALDKVEKLQGVTFDWKESDSILDIKEDIGFIAQDVQKVLPELVRENDNGKLSLRHQGIVPILLEAIKELSDKVKALENGSTR